MSFENLLLNSNRLIKSMEDNGYSKSYILLLKTEINWLRKNGDLVDSYEAACTIREGQTDSHEMKRRFRLEYGILKRFTWEDDSFTFSDKLHYLSKSMGHSHIQSTLYYYSIVPRLADKIQAKTEKGFNEIVPEVWNEEEN